jgi:hypothetical protein
MIGSNLVNPDQQLDVGINKFNQPNLAFVVIGDF